MPSRKRGRAESDEEEEPGEASEARVCGLGHLLVLVSKEVRRLEKDKSWQCSGLGGRSCPLDWDEDESYPERARYRCVHYSSGGQCRVDLCGDCYNQPDDGKIRRSLRESKPSAISRGAEWHIEKKGKFSPTEGSPGRVGRRSNDFHSPGSASTRGSRSVSLKNGSSGKADVSPRRTRRTEDGLSVSRHSSLKKHSPKSVHSTTRRTRNGQKDIYVESEADSDGNKEDGQEEDSPFYPRGAQHVRFSPNAKVKEKGSPFGRKTRSSRRGLSSYIQSLPSEDEQSEFNRHYRNDLRRRQHRRASEEEVRPGRGEAGVEEELTISTRRSRRRRLEEADQEDEEDSEGVGDPTVTESSLRRSTRRNAAELIGGEEADTESGVDKQDDSDDQADADVEEGEDIEEKDESVSEKRTSKRLKNSSMVSSADEDTPVTRTRRSSRIARNITSDEEEEEEEEEEAEEQVELEEGELSEDHDRSRRSSRRNRVPVNRFQSGLDDSRSQRHSEDSQESEEEPEDRRRITRAADKKKKKSPLKRRQYGLRENRREVRRYTDEFPGREDRSSRDQGLIRRGANISRPGKNSKGGASHKGRRRHRTGDSSSPSDSVSSDEEAFEMRKSKRMRIEMERMRPMNMSKNDVNKSIFRDRAKAGSSLADVQPMEMDMGVTFDNVGGLKDQVNALKEMVMFPLLYPEMFKKFDIQPPRGVLFYGPPGTGKTLLARALASECSSENKKVAFFMRKGADCLSKWIGESERQLRMLFDQAYQMRPSIIFFDEIDGLAPVRSSRQDQIHSSIVSTLLALMDGLDNRGEIVIIGATNRIENIDPALRRPGRFDREFRFYLPDRKTRKEIIKLHTKTWDPPISEPLLNTLGTRTIGYCGADLKGLTAEAALNSLRRSYPQVYESSQKLAIDMNVVRVMKVDFEKALRKIVPSTHRVEDRLLGPLTKQIRPLLSHTLEQLTNHVKKTFPHSSKGKAAVLPASLTHRPRLLIMAGEGQGGTTYLAPALLHFMEKLPVTKLDIAALFSNSARTPEEAVTSLIHQARRTQPGVLYIPHLSSMWSVCSETVRATLITALTDCPPTAPMLVLAVSSTPYHELDDSLQTIFSQHYRETFRVENPGENDRREFFRPLVASCSQPPYKPPPPPPPRESLPVVPAPENRQLTEKEEKRLKRKEEALLRELRIFLRDIWTKINRENKFFMFRMPVNTDEVDDYLKYVRVPMDFESMHMKLDDGEYSCAQDFLNDIDLIAENAIDYNCDLKYETNRIICHRARALQDFAYALVKAEMDTDFEDECKEIHRRRVEASDKLKKFDKNAPKPAMASPSKMQDIMALVSTACKVCHSKDDEDAMLLCDGCDAGYHTYCSQPPIEDVPEGDWFCPSCPEHQVKEGATPLSPESKKGGGRSRRRKSRWSSGVVPKKKQQAKKKILESDQENEEDRDVTGESVSSKDLDLTPSSPRPSNSRAAPGPCQEVIVQSQLAEARQEDPSVPTGVRIDQAKILQWSNDLVRLTDNYPVEKLERIYTSMAKVIRRFRTLTDRTDLPTELQAELETVRSQEREWGARHYQHRDRR